MRKLIIICILILTLLSICSCGEPALEPEEVEQSTLTPTPEATIIPEPTPVRSFANFPDDMPETLRDPKIVVKKSERILELWDGDTLFGSCSIGLGWKPEGTKKTEGDGKTPEGEYYVCVRNDQSSYYLSLGVSYPNVSDAEAAFEEGTIDQETYDEIIEANNNKTRPPQKTAMGGEIMIHGCGGDRDWTAGCVAVDDDIMDILWQYCPNKTPIIIEP